MSELLLTTEGETHVVVKRRFEASPEAVYRAHMDPELIQQWCLGPEGWTMPVCINEGRPGGKIRYEWANGKGGGFFLTGEILELEPPHRIVHVERMHMSLPDAETRKVMLSTGMEHGMEASYARLERLLGWTAAA